MIDHLNKIISLLNEGKLISEKSFNGFERDDALDERDSDPFDSDWIKAFNQVELELNKIDLSKELSDKIDTIRELAFKITGSIVGVSEFSEYVCDDFELIAKSIVADYTDPWMSALLDAYLSGQFPSGLLAANNNGVIKLLENA